MKQYPGMLAAPGFTLVEMAIVLVIVLVLMGGLMAGLTSQVDARNQALTEQTLADIKEALLGFAVAQGRLPCPATVNTSGIENPNGGGACANPYDGFVPGTTLGITPTDSLGYVLDGWNRPIRYAIATDRNAFSTAGGMRAATIATLNNDITNTPAGFLKVCSTDSASTTACASTATTLSSSAVAVIYSLGRNGATGGAGTDEKQNPNPNTTYAADIVFVSHDPSSASSARGEFDDIVTWISPYTLYSRMITAGMLP